MMEAVRTSEMSVYFNVTSRLYIPEFCKLHTRRRENLKSHLVKLIVMVKNSVILGWRRNPCLETLSSNPQSDIILTELPSLTLI
jgi:hypothetical protein